MVAIPPRDSVDADFPLYTFATARLGAIAGPRIAKSLSTTIAYAFAAFNAVPGDSRGDS